MFKKLSTTLLLVSSFLLLPSLVEAEEWRDPPLSQRDWTTREETDQATKMVLTGQIPQKTVVVNKTKTVRVPGPTVDQTARNVAAKAAEKAEEALGVANDASEKADKALVTRYTKTTPAIAAEPVSSGNTGGKNIILFGLGTIFLVCILGWLTWPNIKAFLTKTNTEPQPSDARHQKNAPIKLTGAKLVDPNVTMTPKLLVPGESFHATPSRKINSEGEELVFMIKVENHGQTAAVGYPLKVEIPEGYEVVKDNEGNPKSLIVHSAANAEEAYDLIAGTTWTIAPGTFIYLKVLVRVLAAPASPTPTNGGSPTI